MDGNLMVGFANKSHPNLIIGHTHEGPNVSEYNYLSYIRWHLGLKQLPTLMEIYFMKGIEGS